jgi:hypothetical protein
MHKTFSNLRGFLYYKFDGDGYGDLADIEDGYGSGYGYGSCSGYGDGYGDGDDYGDDFSLGYGDDHGDGYGDSYCGGGERIISNILSTEEANA